jgi:hypothetical protein
MSSKFGSYGEENLAWSGEDVKSLPKSSATRSILSSGQ